MIKKDKKIAIKIKKNKYYQERINYITLHKGKLS